MNESAKLNINLASRPLRNRRFFFAAAVALGVLVLLLAWLAFGSLARYKSEQAAALGAHDRLETSIARGERDRNAQDLELKERIKKDKARVDLVNEAIMKKAFGWVEFFALLLERALPQASYISSMAPVAMVEGKFEVKFKVVSRSMEDLLQLTRNLMAITGRPPFVNNETRSGGQLVAEITLTYEKSH